MGRQYVRQSFSSASSAAGDSPCASSTTVQCVVQKAVAPYCPAAAESIPVSEVTLSSAGTLRSKQKVVRKASLHSVTILRHLLLNLQCPALVRTNALEHAAAN